MVGGVMWMGGVVWVDGWMDGWSVYIQILHLSQHTQPTYPTYPPTQPPYQYLYISAQFMQSDQQQQDKPKEPESKDNVEEFQLKMPSAEEQVRILALINKEEIFDISNIQPPVEEGVYIEEQPDKILEKLLQLSQAPLIERNAYVKHLAELILILEQAGLDRLSDIIDQIIADSDEIKRNLIIQLRILSLQLEQQANGLAAIKQHIIPALMQLLKYHNFDIQSDSSTEVARLAQLLNDQERMEMILRDAIILGHDEEIEDNKMAALELYGQIAKAVGQQYAESFLVHELIMAGEDLRPRIRKQAVMQIPKLANEVGEQCLLNKLIPFYIQKAEEKASWQVRKVCAEVIVQLAKVCPIAIKSHELTNKMIHFLKDTNKWVKAAAFLQLGQFIECLSDCKPVNEQLAIEFCKVITKDVHEFFTTELDILDPAAFNFPAVLQTLGKSHWPGLSKVFHYLSKYNNKNIRKPLACSLHEIAKIVGPQIAAKELIGVLDQQLKDPEDEIKYGAAKCLWEFISLFDADIKDNMLDVFLIIQKDQKKWRIRELISRQIHHLVDLYSADTIFQIIVPISLKLCNDIVASVRKQAAKQMQALLVALNQKDEISEAYHQCLVENIKAFANSNRYNQRQAFAYMCSNLMNSVDFEELFLEQLVDLSADPVRNVRISVARVIMKHIKHKGLFSEHKSILKIVETYQTDPIREIQYIVNH